MLNNWTEVRRCPPTEGKLGETKISDANGERNFQTMSRRGRLWWPKGGDMYAYYTPTHWREVSNAD